MKKLKADMDRYFDRMDKRWRALPIRKQRRYTLYFFVGYLLFTAGVIFKVWHGAGASKDDMHIQHIENPIPGKGENPASQQDTLQENLKNRIDERN